MKKLVMGLLGAMMILSLAACTPTTMYPDHREE